MKNNTFADIEKMYDEYDQNASLLNQKDIEELTILREQVEEKREKFNNVDFWDLGIEELEKIRKDLSETDVLREELDEKVKKSNVDTQTLVREFAASSSLHNLIELEILSIDNLIEQKKEMQQSLNTEINNLNEKIKLRDEKIEKIEEVIKDAKNNLIDKVDNEKLENLIKPLEEELYDLEKEKQAIKAINDPKIEELNKKLDELEKGGHVEEIIEQIKNGKINDFFGLMQDDNTRTTSHDVSTQTDENQNNQTQTDANQNNQTQNNVSADNNAQTTQTQTDANQNNQTQTDENQNNQTQNNVPADNNAQTTQTTQIVNDFINTPQNKTLYDYFKEINYDENFKKTTIGNLIKNGLLPAINDKNFNYSAMLSELNIDASKIDNLENLQIDRTLMLGITRTIAYKTIMEEKKVKFIYKGINAQILESESKLKKTAEHMKDSGYSDKVESDAENSFNSEASLVQDENVNLENAQEVKNYVESLGASERTLSNLDKVQSQLDENTAMLEKEYENLKYLKGLSYNSKIKQKRTSKKIQMVEERIRSLKEKKGVILDNQNRIINSQIQKYIQKTKAAQKRLDSKERTYEHYQDARGSIDEIKHDVTIKYSENERQIQELASKKNLAARLASKRLELSNNKLAKKIESLEKKEGRIDNIYGTKITIQNAIYEGKDKLREYPAKALTVARVKALQLKEGIIDLENSHNLRPVTQTR